MNENFSRDDRDLLIRLEVILKELKLDFDNHLTDHKKYMYFAYSTCVGLIITLIVLLIKTP